MRTHQSDAADQQAAEAGFRMILHKPVSSELVRLLIDSVDSEDPAAPSGRERDVVGAGQR